MGRALSAAQVNPVPIERIAVSVYTIPTDEAESDGTFEWNATTLVLVRIGAGGHSGIGYTYADSATACVVRDTIAPLLEGRDALQISGRWKEMAAAVRNLGRPGIASMAIAGVDTALWDLKGKLYDTPLATLLGMTRECVPVYGSGGFTSYSIDRLQQQLATWTSEGLTRVKMKVGRDPQHDVERVHAASQAIGTGTELFVDANGAYARKQALQFAEDYADAGVTWFEEPVSSDDLAGLHLLRSRGPAGMAISAGEYGYDLPYFRRMLEAQAVDVLQADATRCGGITGFLGAAALCEAHGVPLSSHCGPALHVALCCHARPALHLEYFHDHARIERMLFDGAPLPRGGAVSPDLSRPGLGIEFRDADARLYAS